MTDADTFLAERQRYSDARLAAYVQALEAEIPASERAELIGDHTCIYAVGSGGRRELSEHSDLDVFLVTHAEPRRIDEVRLQSAVLRAMRAERFEDASDDASFLKLHSARSLVERLGQPRDDSDNTFTVRMLLLLESRALVGRAAHERLASIALDAYWKNTEAHRADYLPIILLNDIIRYWRILLLNYESKSAEKQRRLESQREELTAAEIEAAQLELEADNRLRSYKLRFSRCLMCYSSIAYLLRAALDHPSESGGAHITRPMVEEMVRRTPLERLNHAVAAGRAAPEVVEIGAALKALYVQFLKDSGRPRTELRGVFTDRKLRKPLFNAAKEFGQRMFELVEALGRNNPLYRYLVV